MGAVHGESFLGRAYIGHSPGGLLTPPNFNTPLVATSVSLAVALADTLGLPQGDTVMAWRETY
jgi:hypothetical protein